MYSQRPRYYYFYQVATILPILGVVSAQNHGQGNFTSVGDAFWQLAGLKAQPNSYSHRRPSLGGQNFTHCCLRAMNESLEVLGGTLFHKEPSYINASIDDLLAAVAGDQFPCTASWNGNTAGAPKVRVPAWWLESKQIFHFLTYNANPSQILVLAGSYLIPPKVMSLSGSPLSWDSCFRL
jgi:hypothetical protein